MAMVFFLATDGKTRVSLDSEASVSVSLPSKVAKSSTMSGKAVSDDVIEGNAVISVQGMVTYSKLKSQENNLNPVELLEALHASRRNRQRFTLYVKDDGQPLLIDYEDCVISSAEVLVDRFSDASTVSLVFEQTFVSESAKTSYLAPISSEATKPTTSSRTDSGDGSKENKDKNESSSIVYSLVERYNEFMDTYKAGVQNGTGT